MIFLHPEYLYFMLLPLLFLLFLIFTNKSQVDRLYSKEIMEKLKIQDGSIGQKGRNIFLSLALVLMVIAFARPVIPKGEINVKSSTVDILVGIDISKSMLANDIYPNRLDFAKKRVIDLMNDYKKARFGVIAFSRVGFLVSPLSDDTNTVEYLVNNLSTNSLNQDGTDLMAPLYLANRFLKNEKEKILVLFTDGGDGNNFTKEIKYAKKHNIRVYVYAIGTEKGSTIRVGSDVLKDKNGNIVIVRLNSAIKKLAIQSGGAYIVGDYSGTSIKKLQESIKNRVKQTKQRNKIIKTYKELFYYPLWAAIMFMLFGFSSMPKRKIAQGALIFLIILFIPATVLKAGILDFQHIKQAKEYYNGKSYANAAKLYKNLLKNNPNNAQLKYNLANSLYKQKKYKEALKQYKDVKNKTENLEFDKYFNEGNSYAYLKKYQEAIDSYKKALKLKNDKDAKHNLELIEKLLKKKKNRNKKNRNKKQKNKKKNKNGNGKKSSGKNSKKNSKNSKNNKSNSESKNNKRENNKKQKQNNSAKKKENRKKSTKKSQKKNKAKQNKMRNTKSQGVNKKIMSDAEEKKWTRIMFNKRAKTLPLEINTKVNNLKYNGKDW